VTVVYNGRFCCTPHNAGWMVINQSHSLTF